MDDREATLHAESREVRQYTRDVIAEILQRHDAAQRRNSHEFHEGNRHETAGVIYDKVMEIAARRSPVSSTGSDQ